MRDIYKALYGDEGTQTWPPETNMMMMMMMMNFIHVSMYLADANWGHNIKIK